MSADLFALPEDYFPHAFDRLNCWRCIRGEVATDDLGLCEACYEELRDSP